MGLNGVGGYVFEKLSLAVSLATEDILVPRAAAFLSKPAGPGHEEQVTMVTYDLIG